MAVDELETFRHEIEAAKEALQAANARYQRLLAERDRLLAEVETERRLLATILQHLPAGVVIGEAHSGKVMLVNDTAAAHLDHWASGLRRGADSDADRAQATEQVLRSQGSPLARALRGESLTAEEVEVLSANGDRKVSTISAAPIKDAHGDIVAAVVTFTDITERKKVEAALAESERNYRVLFEQASVGIKQITLDGRIIAVNDQICALLGYSRDELLKMTFVDLTDPADLPRERRRQRRLYSGKVDSYVIEKRYIRRNGTRLWARETSSLARNDDGVVLYRMAIIEDISEWRRTQQALRESEARYRATFDHAAVGIAHMALDGRWLAVNDRMCTITGYSREELLRGRFQDIAHPDDLDTQLAAMAQVAAGDRDVLAMEKRFVHRGGAIVWVSMTSALVRDDDGAPAYMISVFDDVTEDLRTALLDARLAALVRTSHDAILSFGHDGSIDSWNSGAEQLFGYSAEEIIGQSQAVLVPAPELADDIEAVERLARGEPVVTMESHRRRKNGTIFPCVITMSQIRGLHDKLLGFSATIRDITERRQWEERQRLMARELVHRVKNSFAVIQSIVRQTQRSTPDPEAFAHALGGRLAAMAASHDLLTERHWEGAELRDLVEGQLAAFAATEETRVRIDGPEVVLDASLALPLGLALHELATNATKHGSLSRPEGSVELSWSVTRRENKEWLSLIWREIGGPAITPPTRRGFGTSLIERGLPDARIERRFQPEGLVCLIELPVLNERSAMA